MGATNGAAALVAHEAANILPMMGEAEFAAFMADIEDNGLREPIIVYKGKILDGRHRYKACLELSIDPDLLKLDDHDIGHDPIAYVKSVNLWRRHLTDGQRAMVAVESEKMYAAALKGKEKARKTGGDSCTGAIVPSGTAAEKAAFESGVSARSVASAKKVVNEGAKQVADAVRSGQVSVKVAEKLVRTVPDKHEQAAIIKEAVKADKPDKAIHAAVAPRNPAPIYTISDNAIDVVNRFVGLAHCIQNEYGGLAGMFANKYWDKDETLYFKQQLRALSLEIAKLDKEAQRV